jgi:DNA-binding NtrC family response regulator
MLLTFLNLICTTDRWSFPIAVTSKHDSMDIVYQCLSKGAADFLVKPVRKNELKNLWQHVWRKRNIVSHPFCLFVPILLLGLDTNLQDVFLDL